MARTVLLVEDNPDNRDVYSMLLKHVGYGVIEAMDGEEGLRQAREAQPDVILLDISLPKLDGWAVNRLLQEDERTSHIPVVALTAHALAEDRERAVEAGFDGYLAKPIAPKQVVEEVKRLVGEADG